MSYISGQKVRAGQANFPTTPFVQFTGAPQAIANLTDTACNISAVVENNTGQTWWTNANPSYIIVPSGYGGMYNVNAQFWFPTAASGAGVIHWQHGPGGPSNLLWQASGGMLLNTTSEAHTPKIAEPIRLVAGDTYQLMCWQNSGGSLTSVAIWNLMNAMKISLEYVTA